MQLGRKCVVPVPLFKAEVRNYYYFSIRRKYIFIYFLFLRRFQKFLPKINSLFQLYPPLFYKTTAGVSFQTTCSNQSGITTRSLKLADWLNSHIDFYQNISFWTKTYPRILNIFKEKKKNEAKRDTDCSCWTVNIQRSSFSALEKYSAHTHVRRESIIMHEQTAYGS